MSGKKIRKEASKSLLMRILTFSPARKKASKAKRAKFLSDDKINRFNKARSK